MTKDEVRETVASFGRAAGRAKAAGFDAVQIHGAHGYLINQFLSPYTNRRRDEYGGSLQNRWRFVQEVYQAARQNVGADFPVLIKINATDGFPIAMGVQFDEALETAKMLAELGLDAIEVSCGCYESGMTTIRGPMEFRLALRTVAEAREANALARATLWAITPLIRNAFPFRKNYNLEYAAKIKAQVKVPIITVGGIRDPKTMEAILQSGQADLIALARPLISDPDFPRKIAAGDLSPSRCVNCNICLVHIQQSPLRCFAGVMPRPARPPSCKTGT
jgi:2,4-dienoyl-CoA reductase-like NADH-dependent reductase (Old Yellow Enzyme family)